MPGTVGLQIGAAVMAVAGVIALLRWRRARARGGASGGGAALCVACVCMLGAMLHGQGVMTGTLTAREYTGSANSVPMTAVHCFASAAGADRQAVGFRTWETHPAGWYCLAGGAGNYSVVFSDPAGFMRPLVVTNQCVADGDRISRSLAARFDYADFFQGQWDERPATDYFQTFVARGTSVTSVGFRLATDGVDGAGPLANRVLVSIHRGVSGTPDTWPQVGVTAVAPHVDCGGPKNYIFSVGFNSREAPTVPGEVYAVRLRAAQAEYGLQAFWRPVPEGGMDCYRIGRTGPMGWQNRNLCMTVASDSDGLVIPYNKRVHETFKEFAGFDRSWAQTYVAQGRSLAAVILYAATSGVQPSMNRQRLKVGVRDGRPDGPRMGIEKIAIGNGNYTGDASWGVFGVSFAPGEVVLVPGRTYAITFESIETHYTLDGFVNIKGQVSDGRPGFNPYRKVPPDDYAHGQAWRRCVEPQPFDLDMQVIEYNAAGENWHAAGEEENLLANGGMEEGVDLPDGWTAFRIDARTVLTRTVDGLEANHLARVSGGGPAIGPVDGGFVQRVQGLSAEHTYRLEGRVRCTWAVDEKTWCAVGFDRTGQTDDADAETICWTRLPAVHGQWVAYASVPIRPRGNAISVWLRGKTARADDYPFRADFDGFALRQVATGVPGEGQ